MEGTVSFKYYLQLINNIYWSRSHTILRSTSQNRSKIDLVPTRETSRGHFRTTYLFTFFLVHNFLGPVVNVPLLHGRGPKPLNSRHPLLGFFNLIFFAVRLLSRPLASCLSRFTPSVTILWLTLSFRPRSTFSWNVYSQGNLQVGCSTHHVFFDLQRDEVLVTLPVNCQPSL